jgi:hypothetical protein
MYFYVLLGPLCAADNSTLRIRIRKFKRAAHGCENFPWRALQTKGRPMPLRAPGVSYRLPLTT